MAFPSAVWVPAGARSRLRRLTPAAVPRAVGRLTHGTTGWQRRRDALVARRRAVTLDRGQPTIAVRHHGAVRLAVVVDRFEAQRVFDEHLQMVVEALREAGVAHVTLPTSANRRHLVVVPETERAAAVRALRARWGRSPVYVSGLRADGPTSARLLRARRIGLPTPGLRLFRVLAGRGGQFLGGVELGCDVQFWTETTDRTPATASHERFPAGSLTSPGLVNQWTDVVLPGERHVRPGSANGVAVPRLQGVTEPHVFQTSFPIDVVYTWVDGSDPVWRASKERELAALGDHDGLHELSLNASRFVSRDELRYSLRSLQMYADWVRHIYIVTAGQRPAWLNTDDPRITLVDHTELFGDRGQLPTFNSHAIETQLHHIPGLSEHFLYLNDDVFFGSPVAPEDFFASNGAGRFCLSQAKIGLGAPRADDTPVVSAAKNNRLLLQDRFDVTITHRMQHVPHALRRSVLTDLEREFPAALKQTAHSQFRSATDVSVASSLAHYYGYLTGRAVPGKLRYFYADIARPETQARLETLLHARGHDVLCLNDVDHEASGAQAMAGVIEAFLTSYYPLPSSFETSTPRGVERAAA